MSVSILLFFAIVFVLVYLLRSAKIGALVAFLLTGVLSGPYVFNLFELNETWSFLGDLGILFLWFNIGLEINIRRLWRLRRTIFGFGATQVLMVVVMLFPLMVGVIVGCYSSIFVCSPALYDLSREESKYEKQIKASKKKK